MTNKVEVSEELKCGIVMPISPIDGSDFDNGLYNNTWLASFQITTEQASSNDVPEPSTLAIFALGIAGLVTRRLNK